MLRIVVGGWLKSQGAKRLRCSDAQHPETPRESRVAPERLSILDAEMLYFME